MTDCYMSRFYNHFKSLMVARMTPDAIHLPHYIILISNLISPYVVFVAKKWKNLSNRHTSNRSDLTAGQPECYKQSIIQCPASGITDQLHWLIKSIMQTTCMQDSLHAEQHWGVFCGLQVAAYRWITHLRRPHIQNGSSPAEYPLCHIRNTW